MDVVPPRARPIKVPLKADSVLSPLLRYGSLPIEVLQAPDGSEDVTAFSALYFPLDGDSGTGRVTFEGPDSRMTRPWTGLVSRKPGVAEPQDFMKDWEQYLDEVAERRRAMGKRP